MSTAQDRGDLRLRSVCDQEENRDGTTRHLWIGQKRLEGLKRRTDGNKTD